MGTTDWLNRMPTMTVLSPDEKFLILGTTFDELPTKKNPDGTLILWIPHGPDSKLHVIASNAPDPDGIVVFPVGGDGALGERSFCDAGAPSPFYIAFLHNRPDTFIVGYAVGDGVSMGHIDANGKIRVGPLVPLNTGAGKPSELCWLAISPDDRSVFATSFGYSSISSYRIDGAELSIAKDPACPKVQGDGAFRAINGTVSSGPSDNWITPDGAYLYQVYGNAAKLVGYAIQPEGSLNQITNVTIPYIARKVWRDSDSGQWGRDDLDIIMSDRHCRFPPLALLRLQSWLSPAFPTGAYSYSHGLEWAVEAGHVDDRKSLVHWLDADLCYGSGRNEAIFFIEAWRCTIDDDRAKLFEIAELAAAFRGTSELALESSQQAAASLATLQQAWPDPVLNRLAEMLCEHSVQPALSVILGTRLARQGIPAALALPSFLQNYLANLVTAAVRLIPLGQTDGQLAIAELEEFGVGRKCASRKRDDRRSRLRRVHGRSGLHGA